MKTVEQIIAEHDQLASPSIFAPKLTPYDRCFVLALHLLRYTQPQIASFFNIHPRTVGLIVRNESPKYKSTRKELERWGRDEFLRRYITTEQFDKFRTFISEGKKQVANAPNASTPSTKFKQHASAMAGWRFHREYATARAHIFWDVGWWWQAESEDDRFGPYPTSAAAYDAYNNEWMPL